MDDQIVLLILAFILGMIFSSAVYWIADSHHNRRTPRHSARTHHGRGR